MRLQVFLAALVVPIFTHSFSLHHRALIGTRSARAVSSSRRCSSNTALVMTLPPPLGRLAGTVLLGGVLLVAGTVGTTDVARADVSISPRCITGEGPQCEDLAEGNDYIKSLQAKSAATKDQYFQETLDKYNYNNFKDYFRAENKHMVKHKNGKYEILTNGEYIDAERAGKVKDEAFVEG